VDGLTDFGVLGTDIDFGVDGTDVDFELKVFGEDKFD
jgi:hypothetical protein